MEQTGSQKALDKEEQTQIMEKMELPDILKTSLINVFLVGDHPHVLHRADGLEAVNGELDEGTSQLSKKDRMDVCWRHQFLQGSWNYERMQNRCV